MEGKMSAVRTYEVSVLPASASADWRGRLARAWRVLSTRHHLAEMDERMLKDIGITRSTAKYIATRPFWDALR
jgi:uncharacterized protein YjiS (DUF1127 family)